MEKVYITWEDIFTKLSAYDLPGNIIYGVPKGGMILTAFLRHASITHKPEKANLILDDVIDSGNTKEKYAELYANTRFVALFDLQHPVYPTEKPWLVFPWEAEHPGGEDSIEQNIVRILQYIGEDVTREGLKDTPKRVVKSWGELYGGYSKKPEDLLTVFDSGTYDQIILLKNIEFHSTCEHHMLPFSGIGHVAYIPKTKVIGISKLARLLDMYTKRLQIQERIGEQVTDALMTYLQPLGAACILEASHSCMKCRGVQKQNSIMVTSSIKGIFRQKLNTKEELMQLIRK